LFLFLVLLNNPYNQQTKKMNVKINTVISFSSKLTNFLITHFSTHAKYPLQKVKEGDVVTMCSATFGDQMWSTRGVGLSRVLSAIRVRAGPTVKLVFESSKETAQKAKNSSRAAAAAEEARLRAQEKKDQLLKELQEDEKKLKKGKFLGLF
jgi:hypothetical protein